MASMKIHPISAQPLTAQPLTEEQRTAMEPLEDAIGNLLSARKRLELQRAKHSRKYYDSEGRRGNLNDDFFKQGTAAQHLAQTAYMEDERTMHGISSDVPVSYIAKIHKAIAERMKEVKEAHKALSASHPKLAWKDGSMGYRNRKYKTPSGETQSLGRYHGKPVTPDGTPQTFEGGRKTRKRKRKTRKRKTRKRKTRKRKTRKRKTRKYKKTTRHGRKRRTSKKQLGRGNMLSGALIPFGDSVQPRQPQFGFTLADANIAKNQRGFDVSQYPSCNGNQCQAWPKGGPRPTGSYSEQKPTARNPKKRNRRERREAREYKLRKRMSTIQGDLIARLTE